MGWDNLKFHKKILFFCDRNLFFKKNIFDIFRKYFFGKSKFSLKINMKFLKKFEKIKKNPDFFRDFSNFFIWIFNENFWKFPIFRKNIFEKCQKYFSWKINFDHKKLRFFLWNFKLSHPMSRPSSSCIFGSSGPVEVSERGSYIVEFLVCF